MNKHTIWLNFLFLLLTLPSFAQFEGGISFGFAGHEGDVHCFAEQDAELFRFLHPTFGIFAQRTLNKGWSLRADLQTLKLSGDDIYFKDAVRAARGISFENTFTEFTVLLQHTLLHKNRDEKEVFKKSFSPYLFGGGGAVLVDYDVNFTDSDSPEALADAEVAPLQPTAAVGMGLRFDPAPRVAWSLEGKLRLPISDYYDGVSISGSPAANDVYGSMEIKMFFSLDKPTENELKKKKRIKDFDGDGIADKIDICPKVFGAHSTGGCPDADGDGIKDTDDTCPNAAGTSDNNGCPDSDNDSVSDMKDDCPFVFGLPQFNGCPDSDGDGLPDKSDVCPDEAGLPVNQGCPDTDGDGIWDKEDACPKIKGVPEEMGCPWPDTDADGIADKDDDCPNEPGTVENNGCPFGDTDGDGVYDHDDICPDTPGTAKFSGCPPPSVPTSAEIKSTLYRATQNVNFNVNGDILTQTSEEILDEVAEILRYSEARLRINGHTDAQGAEKYNLLLSQKRAEACRGYLIEKGIDPQRLTARGFGESRPLASNDTAEGRQANRRVEFEIL